MRLEDAIQLTQKELLKNEGDWRDRYKEYISGAVDNIESIVAKRKKFHKWGKLSVYYTLGRAKDDSNWFDLRYEGQSVGSIVVQKCGIVKLNVSAEQYSNNCNDKYIKGYPLDVCKVGSYDWNSSEAKVFRKFFANAKPKKGHPEHRCENLLLEEFSKKRSKDKSLCNIQPVTIGVNSGIFFQMPTPLTASGHEIKYSNGHGGIDILARTNISGKHRLTVIELKDEYKKSEGPEKVIAQAIAYATFLVELCKTEAKDHFWKLCGFGREIQKGETINVAVLMPDPCDGSKPCFSNKVLEVPDSDMKLELHYLFFVLDEDEIRITRTSL